MRRTPQSAQLGGKARKLRAVGGQRQFIERAGVEMARQRAHQRHHVAPDQRLAAGQPQLAHALGDEGRAQPVEFFQRQQIGLGQECHVFGHAIEAAQVAAIGDRYPQIADGPAERVDHRTEQRRVGTNQSAHSHHCLFCAAVEASASAPSRIQSRQVATHSQSAQAAGQCRDQRAAGGAGLGKGDGRRRRRPRLWRLRLLGLGADFGLWRRPGGLQFRDHRIGIDRGRRRRR